MNRSGTAYNLTRGTSNMPITPITPTGPSAPNTLTPDAAGAVAVPNTLTPDAAGAVAVPNTLTPDAAGTVAAPNTLSADAAGTVAAPNTLSADAAGTIAAPISLPSVTAAAFPRSLTPMVDFDFAAKSYAKNGLAVAFDDIFTYTRASSATFTNRRLKKNGGYEYFLDTDYVGNVTNLLKYSEDFTGSDWSSSLSGDGSVSVLSNTTLSPNNDMTADTITVNATGLGIAALVQPLSSTVGNPYSVSAYFKAARPQDVGKTILIRGAASGTYVNVVLSDNWLKSNSTQQASSSSFTLDITHRPSLGSTSGEIQFYVWGAQLTQSAKPLPYVKTLDVAVTKTFAETLRTEYDAVTGENLGALIEGSSTNLALRSEEFSNATWSKVDATITANAIKAPDGTNSADKLAAASTASIVPNGYQVVTSVAAQSYSISFYAKQAETDFVQIYFSAGQVANNPRANFNLASGVVGTVDADITATIEYSGEGVYRITASVVAVGTALRPFIALIKSASDTKAQSNAWTIGDGVYIWGAQLEAKPFATSYIRTEGAAVSRSSDNLNIDGNSSIPEGGQDLTVSIDVSMNDADNHHHYAKLFRLDGQDLYMQSFAAGINNWQAVTNNIPLAFAPDISSGVTHSFATTYTSSKIAAYFNSVETETITTFTPTFYNRNTTLSLGSSSTYQHIDGHISKFKTYAQALTQQEITLL